jgi:predicted membrane chloride channel (bestrophin family)
MAGIVLGAAAASVAVTLVVRRSIRDDATAQELDRRVPTVFAFVGTAFAVLLAFVVLEAYQNFDEARKGADTEALTVVQISRTVDGFAPAQRNNFEGLLLCYARAVVHHDWPSMRNGDAGSPQVDL